MADEKTPPAKTDECEETYLGLPVRNFEGDPEVLHDAAKNYTPAGQAKRAKSIARMKRIADAARGS